MLKTKVIEKFARAVSIPDLDTGLTETLGRGVTLNEPEELGNDGASEDTLRGKEGENGGPVVVEGEFQGKVVQDSRIDGLLPIWSTLAGLKNFPNEVKVLVLFMVDKF
ncbi:hypothetical protein HG531_001598 [Fusarium graminearum]|nr:hypothetical protein HG531_001598 [Fusarium graminearum]